MPTIEKRSVPQIINEGKRRVHNSISSTLNCDLERLTVAFTERMGSKIVDQFYSRRGITAIRNVQPGSQIEGHGTVSRTDSDRAMTEQISGIIRDYNATVGKAIDRIGIAADERAWEPKQVEQALQAIETDVEKHTGEISGLLTEAAWRINNLSHNGTLHIYVEVIAAAAMLKNDLGQIVNSGLEDHLFVIGRNEWLKDLERTEEPVPA